MNVDHPQKLTHISLCTGYGGIDLGLSRALSGDVRTVAYVEIEAFAVENLVSKIESELLDMAPIWSNLKTFPWSLYRGRVDIISGGFPCQPFSAAGRRAGDEDPRHLFPYILDGLRELGRPSLVFLENVEGIISSKLKGDGWNDPEGTPVLLHVLRELERLGYEATAGVFSAREVGAPHQRKRVFIMGVRSDLGESGRALVSGMLERGEDAGVNQIDTCDNSRRCARASVHGEWRAVDGRRARVQGEWYAPNTHVEHASISADVGEPHARGFESSERRSAERWSGSVQTTKSSTAYPAPRVCMDDTKRLYVQNSIALNSRLDQANRNRPPSVFMYAGFDTTYPAPRGAEQHAWEPPRVSQTEPSMGGDFDGITCGMDYAELCHAVDCRTDELRLLGNGVVPGTAERAFRELWRDLNP